MSEIAVRHPQSMILSNEQLKFIAGTEFVPRNLRGNLPAILACVATGRALGLPDMVALKSINVIDGSPSYSAELMVHLVRKRGHSITGSFGPGAATAKGRRADNGDEIEVTWTTEMAKTAGLLGKSNWKSYPEAMLWARAVSQLCRMLFADCFTGGGTYTAEEIGAQVTDEFGAVIEQEEDDGLFPPIDEPAEDAEVVDVVDDVRAEVFESGQASFEEIARAAGAPV